MMPRTIISGFKTCGVYPFNPKAVLDHDPCVELPNASPVENPSDIPPANSPSQYVIFTPEDEILFQTRYEEGYDLQQNDPKYSAWLRINHVEANSVTGNPFD